MKTLWALIPLLLFVTVAWGQGIVAGPVDSVLYDRYTQGFLPRFLADWQEYKVECANDSTQHDRIEELFETAKKLGYDEPKTTEFIFRMLDGNVPRFYWTPTKPTFPGFMEYLARKVKR